jgi:hypothetical protein
VVKKRRQFAAESGKEGRRPTEVNLRGSLRKCQGRRSISRAMQKAIARLRGPICLKTSKLYCAFDANEKCLGAKKMHGCTGQFQLHTRCTSTWKAAVAWCLVHLTCVVMIRDMRYPIQNVQRFSITFRSPTPNAVDGKPAGGGQSSKPVGDRGATSPSPSQDSEKNLTEAELQVS